MTYFLFNIHDVVLLMTTAECLLLAIFQSALPTRSRHDGRLLTAFLIIVALASACTLVLWSDQFRSAPWGQQSLIPYLLFTALLLKGPAIYCYICALTRQNFSLSPHMALHAVPAVLAIACIAVFDISSSDLRHSTAPGEMPPAGAIAFVWDLASVTPFAYALAALRQVRRYRRELNNEYSHYSEVELNWLMVPVWGVCIAWAWTATVHIVAKFTSDYIADYMGIVDIYVSFVLVNAFFAYNVTYAQHLLATRPETASRKAAPEEDEPSKLSIEKVLNGMERERFYLKSNINIEQFSEKIGLPVKEVSTVINKHFGTNFFEYVNSYRIETAKTLLADPANSHMTVLDVLLESGFNSKSAFHRFFNRLVGMSPTEFRKKALSANPQAQTP
ncbi:helix-turn-helix transcriptional regulator [Microbulbifer salipaludis]|uniref:Helix-turn-helix transcriptional regulator n=1 Tax=Microbulbifer salipaludis TaxID=187980 RepID=A0ABS3E518_9GAMM|nr:helix-turn-helix transcriptional regulator [Microbulbifer salipaludis]MBN8430395.1 helix-turn-helix transcriptional regulator [Microbulbifer salipaludis]